jgi:hypothetical protein
MGMDAAILRANEKYKLAAGTAANLGAALLAAAFGRWFLVGFDPFDFQWLVVATMMIWWGLHLLSALEPDDAAG